AGHVRGAETQAIETRGAARRGTRRGIVWCAAFTRHRGLVERIERGGAVGDVPVLEGFVARRPGGASGAEGGGGAEAGRRGTTERLVERDQPLDVGGALHVGAPPVPEDISEQLRARPEL